MIDYLGCTRACGTCHWWDGERRADPPRGRVYTGAHGVMGTCRSPLSWWEGRPRQAESECRFWRPWAATGAGFGAAATGRDCARTVILRPAMDHPDHRGSPSSAASHVLLVEPARFRFNPETGATNAFQVAPSPGEEERLSILAVEQHRQLRDLLVANGVSVTVARSLDATPDAPFCNNWFSTHPGDPGSGTPATLVLYPLLAENRRTERRGDLIAMLAPSYPNVIDLSPNERQARFLESTGSLVLDHERRAAYAAISPRTDPDLAREWARRLGYELIAFTAVDRNGVPYYHTNVLMFIGHGLAGVCLEAIRDPAERARVEERLRRDGREILPLTQEQAASFCGNCLALAGSSGEPLFVMSSQAWRAFGAAERAVLERHARVLHSELSAFERLGGGSARCLIAELF